MELSQEGGGLWEQQPSIVPKGLIQLLKKLHTEIEKILEIKRTFDNCLKYSKLNASLSTQKDLECMLSGYQSDNSLYISIY